jgi:prepilin-type N-terminal cleavage/methylation domain-containing protein
LALSAIKKSGFTLVEVVIAIAIFSIFSTGITYLSLDTLQADEKIEDGNLALLYAQEGLEAARQMRDMNFLLLENGDHGLDLTSDVWSFIPAPERVDSYYDRTVSVEDVYRDVNNDIAATGTLDPDAKLITSTIEWNHRGLFPKSVELSTYLSNWAGDDWIQTDCDEFNAGTFTDMEVEFTTSPPENNCALKLALEELESNFYESADVGEHGTQVVVDGNYAYVTVNKTNQGLTVVDITDKQNPFVLTQLNIGGKGLSIAKQGDYLYIGVNKSNAGLAVVDVSSPGSPSLEDTLNVGGYGYSVAPDGNELYMGVNGSSELAVIDITSPTSTSLSSSIGVDGNIYDIDIVGDYAYCGVDYDWQGFQIFDISDPANVSNVSKLAVGEEVNAVEVQGPYAYLGTEESDNSFYVVNISDVENPAIVTYVDVGEEIQDVRLQGDYAYLALDDNNKGLAAINISTPTSPYLVYTLDVQGKGTGLFSDANYVYETIDTNNRGLVLIGTTETTIMATGSYESIAYDTGSTTTRFNYVEWEGADVPGSTITLQLRTASTEAGLASATWIGSDGTGATYYESSRTPIVVSPSASGTRYVQFKVYISSDGASTPFIESVKINYTP